MMLFLILKLTHSWFHKVMLIKQDSKIVIIVISMKTNYYPS